MLTLIHIGIYERFRGNGDGFGLAATEEEKRLMTYADWSAMDNIVLDLHLIKNGLASELFAENFWKRLKESCDGEESMAEIVKFAGFQMSGR